jgi:hypothetical protein
MSVIEYCAEDFRRWCGCTQVISGSCTIRIAIVSKLFNNLSKFSVQAISREALRASLGKLDTSNTLKNCLPTSCLVPDRPQYDQLSINYRRVILPVGRVVPQYSLLPFYEGLYSCFKAQEEPSTNSADCVFLPVRTFSRDCLLTYDKTSIISLLIDISDCLVIEDADLTPQSLIEHANSELKDCSVFDMTKVLRLKRNYVYVICSNRTNMPFIGGERIW